MLGRDRTLRARDIMVVRQGGELVVGSGNLEGERERLNEGIAGKPLRSELKSVFYCDSMV